MNGLNYFISYQINFIFFTFPKKILKYFIKLFKHTVTSFDSSFQFKDKNIDNNSQKLILISFT